MRTSSWVSEPESLSAPGADQDSRRPLLLLPDPVRQLDPLSWLRTIAERLGVFIPDLRDLGGVHPLGFRDLGELLSAVGVLLAEEALRLFAVLRILDSLDAADLEERLVVFAEDAAGLVLVDGRQASDPRVDDLLDGGVRHVGVLSRGRPGRARAEQRIDVPRHASSHDESGRGSED